MIPGKFIIGIIGLVLQMLGVYVENNFLFITGYFFIGGTIGIIYSEMMIRVENDSTQYLQELLGPPI